MIFAIMILLTALTLSTVAAFYSITGLTAIFPGVIVPIIIMGGTLEISKIVATVWLHKYWHRATWHFKAYLIPAILILMIITSTGIFGYLSAAHLSQSTAADDIGAQVSLLDEKIKTQKDNIDAAKRALQQMDSQVDQMLSRTTDAKGTNRAVQIRKQQASERKSLQKDIEIAQKEISTLQSQREPLAAKSRVAESHIGPIKYIAALIYGDNPDANLLERAVRWVIILLVLVFDPLALVLILAAEQTIRWAREDNHTQKQKQYQTTAPDLDTQPKYESDDGPLTSNQIKNIQTTANVDLDLENTSSLFDTEKQFFDHGKEIAQSIDANNGKITTNDFSADEFLDSIDDNAPYLKKPWVWIPANKQGLVPKDDNEVVQKNLTAPNKEHFDPPPIHNIVINDNKVTANFGKQFPSNPSTGMLFVRTDFVPTQLYKWNGVKWIMIDKNSTDVYAYNQEYINYLINCVNKGEYDVDLLTPVELEQITNTLENV